MDDRKPPDTNVVRLRRNGDPSDEERRRLASTIFAEQDEVGTFSRGNLVPPADGGFWNGDDWRNWRRRTWQGEPQRPRRDRPNPNPDKPGAAPKGTRPRDLRSSYVTLRVYEGIPLTQIAREVGTSVRMIEQHYAGVIANWDGKQVPAERSIRAARKN